jgi:hypothetical protein
MYFFERVVALAKDNIQTMIERYRSELIEFNRRNPNRENKGSNLNDLKSKAAEAVAEEKDEFNKFTQQTPDRQTTNNRQPDTARDNTLKTNENKRSGYNTVSEYENSRLYAELNAAENNPGSADGDKRQFDFNRIYPKKGLTRFDDEAVTVMANAADANPETADETQDIPANPEAAMENVLFEVNSGEFPPYSTANMKSYESLDEFLRENTKTGTLRVQVAAAEQSFPISNAEVSVTKTFGKETHTFFNLFTDISGIAAGMTLPAPDRAFSAYPSALAPYATYDITVSHPRFVTVIERNSAIFDGIETIQFCEMVPVVGTIQGFTVFEERR